MPKKKSRAEFAQTLLEWYDTKAVALPWRGSRDPYQIWLSEIMLQQTRVTAVKDYYQKFLTKFPTIEELAAASQDEVLKAWEGLGYYSRARNLHKLAKIVVQEYAGKFPATAEELQKLPGIGRYTAAAIASIVFEERAAVLDGNVIRILTRLYDIAEEIGSPKIANQLWDLAESLLPAERCGDYNQAIMDLGRLICLPRNPVCELCPVQKFCEARKHKTVHLRPVKKAKAPLPNRYALAAIVRDEQARILLVQRPQNGLLGGLWMLPQIEGERDAEAQQILPQYFCAEFGLKIRVAEPMASAKQTFTHFHFSLRAFTCEIVSGKLKAAQNVVWVSKTEIANYSFGKSDQQILAALDSRQPSLFAEYESSEYQL